MTTRRSFIASILVAGAAPAVARSGVLMPVRSLIVPDPTSLADEIWSTPIEFQTGRTIYFTETRCYVVGSFEDMQPLRNGDRITFDDESGRSATLWRMV